MLESVIGGIISGTIAGLLVALFFGVSNLVTSRIERRDQIHFLSATIERFRDQIFSAEDIQATVDNQRVHYTRDNVRKAYFDDMRRNVESILEGRTSRLSYDEVQAVRDAFFTDLYPDVHLNEEGYDKLFSSLESIRWLRLSVR